MTDLAGGSIDLPASKIKDLTPCLLLNRECQKKAGRPWPDGIINIRGEEVLMTVSKYRLIRNIPV
jgi:hypothetical protein